MRYQRIALALAVYQIPLAHAFSFSSPKIYKQNDKVDLLINKVQSDYSQLPYSYYELSFTCPQSEEDSLVTLSLGQVLRGDRIAKSDFELFFNNDTVCETACMRLAAPAGIRKAQELIEQKYSNEWLIDDLPGATTLISTEDNSKYYLSGFPLGFVRNGKYYLNNHAMIVVRFHRENNNGDYSIVGFEVYPRSVSDDHCPGAATNYEPFEVTEAKISAEFGGQIIPYTYSVYWREELSVNWHNRWDLYISKEEDSRWHYISLVYSLFFVALYSVAVAAIFKNINNSNNNSNAKGDSKKQNLFLDSGRWRKLRNEVFEQPRNCLFFAILAGTGVQLFATFSTVVALFAFNILHNNVPGRILSYAVFLFIFSGAVSGYATYFFFDRFSNNSNSSNSSNSLQSTKFRSNTASHQDESKRKFRLANKDKLRSNSKSVITKIEPDWFHVSFFAGAALPGFVIITLLFLNFFVWAKESSTALPFGTIIFLILCYFFCEIPLALIGGYISYKNSCKRNEKRMALPAPVTSPMPSPVVDQFHSDLNKFGDSQKPNAYNSNNNAHAGVVAHSTIPPQPRYLTLLNSILLFGLVPFICFYNELFYIFKIIWLEKNSFYYHYGFLLLSIVVAVVLVSESVIVALYLQLNNGNYKWQWRSFSIGGAMSSYVFLYSIVYYLKHLKPHYDFVSILLYFSYSFLIYLLVQLSLGSVGVISGYFFIRKIYGVKKLD